MRLGLVLWAAIATFASASACTSSSSSDAVKSCTVAGKECRADVECCTSFCQLQDIKAYCQEDRGQMPGCSEALGVCTQNRHCCSGLCEDGTCVGSGTTCSRTSESCATSSTCCSGYCVLGSCQPPPRSNTTGECKPEGTGCAEPDDCCVGFCVRSVCLVPPPGGGGGGTNCGATNAFCRTGADCCTGDCQKTTSSGNCR